MLHSLKVVSLNRETEDAVSVGFEIPKRLTKKFRHRPGQYLTLSRDFPSGNQRRTYSIFEPEWGPCSVLVKRVPEGLFSSFVNEQLKLGDFLDVLEPAGTFGHGIDPAKKQQLVAFAAGSGITPVLPIIESCLSGNAGSTATLVYSNRTTSSIIFRERLCDLKNMHMEKLEVAHVLTQEKTDIPLLSGRIDKRRAAKLIDTFVGSDMSGKTFLLCGPEDLMNTVEKLLLSLGAAPSQIQRERFNAPKVARKPLPKKVLAKGTCQIDVVLNGLRNTIEAPMGKTVLESIKAGGLEAPFSCTNGVCSTCRARLHEGKVEMDVNYALEDEEVEAGMILACQSRPTTKKIVVDFDSLWG